MSTRWYGPAGFLLPLLVLGSMVALHEIHRGSGTEVRLPVRGFDPRHLLSGRYIQYQVVYPVSVCGGEEGLSNKARPASVCLEPPGFQMGEALPAGCRTGIRGYCDNIRFKAGIERFYLPEADAATVERAVMEQRGEILLSVTADGKGAVKALFIDGLPWREFLQRETTTSG